MWNFLGRLGHWHEWVAILRVSLAAARRLGDRSAEATAHRGLGNALLDLGETDAWSPPAAGPRPVPGMATRRRGTHYRPRPPVRVAQTLKEGSSARKGPRGLSQRRARVGQARSLTESAGAQPTRQTTTGPRVLPAGARVHEEMGNRHGMAARWTASARAPISASTNRPWCVRSFPRPDPRAARPLHEADTLVRVGETTRPWATRTPPATPAEAGPSSRARPPTAETARAKLATLAPRATKIDQCDTKGRAGPDPGSAGGAADTDAGAVWTRKHQATPCAHPPARCGFLSRKGSGHVLRAIAPGPPQVIHVGHDRS